MKKKTRPFCRTPTISRGCSNFLYLPFISRAVLFASVFMLSCSMYPTDPNGKDLYEMESVWQYLKTFSMWQDRVPVSAFAFSTPEEMMSSILDTLRGIPYTGYYNDKSHSSPEPLQKSNAAADTAATVGWDSITASTAYLRISEFSTDDSSTFFQFLNVLPYLQRFTNIVIDLIDNGGGGIATTDAIINSILPSFTPYILEIYRRYDQHAYTAKTIPWDTIKTLYEQDPALKNKRYAALMNAGSAVASDSTIPWDTIKTLYGQDPALKNKRFAVLMNEGSASASEIMIAALKDGFANAANGDTVVLIGDTTYGKGMGQIHISRIPWDRPDLLITFMRMRGISGRTGDYHRKGIAPDVLVPYDSSHLAQLTAALKILEPTARLNKQALLQKQLRHSGGIRPEAHINAAPMIIRNR